jgi:predicted Rossmann fold nucleotide-binding protein DprA/Smf involved in DNA uptake
VGSGPSLALGAGYYGDFGRNVFHGPGILNSDISVGKTTRITEGQTLIFRAQAFNFFNHAQFQNPISDINATNFGQITATSESARILQLSLQYRF